LSETNHQLRDVQTILTSFVAFVYLLIVSFPVYIK